MTPTQDKTRIAPQAGGTSSPADPPGLFVSRGEAPPETAVPSYKQQALEILARILRQANYVEDNFGCAENIIIDAEALATLIRDHSIQPVAPAASADATQFQGDGGTMSPSLPGGIPSPRSLSLNPYTLLELAETAIEIAVRNADSDSIIDIDERIRNLDHLRPTMWSIEG